MDIITTREYFFSQLHHFVLFRTLQDINESQKARLEDFFDEIKFYYYTVQKKIESVWDAKVKHKNTLVWPGTDCTFILTVPERNLDKMLTNLKTFRMSLPRGIVMTAGVIPVDRIIIDFLNEDIVPDEELLERLKEKHKVK